MITETEWAFLSDDALFVVLMEHGVTFGRAELLVKYRDEPSRAETITEIING